jgi:hypothetical protein
MSKNNRLPKKVRDIKAQPERTDVQVNPGNTAVLTVRLLNDINNNLVAIKKALEHGRP